MKQKKRTPRNTAVFLYDTPWEDDRTSYIDNFSSTIKNIQSIGFEPHLVSYQINILKMGNLVINSLIYIPIMDCILLEPYIRKHNIVLDGGFDFGTADLERIIYSRGCKFRGYYSIKYPSRLRGYYFKRSVYAMLGDMLRASSVYFDFLSNTKEAVP